LSGFLFESLIQIIVTRDEITSLKLFTASKTIAIEFAKNQIIDLKTTKAILVSIPYKLTLIICLSLFITFRFFINSFYSQPFVNECRTFKENFYRINQDYYKNNLR
jgi:hypothetical protein